MRSCLALLTLLVITGMFVAIALMGRDVFTRIYPAAPALLLVALIVLIGLYVALLHHCISNIRRHHAGYLEWCSGCGQQSEELAWCVYSSDAGAHGEGIYQSWLCRTCQGRYQAQVEE